MNIFKQMKFFWKMHKVYSLGAGEIAMYFYLLEVCNSNDWQNPVTELNSTLMEAIGVKSYNTLCAHRNRLQAAGLLQVKTRNGSSRTEYNLRDANTQTFSIDEKVGSETSSLNEKVGGKKRQTSSTTSSINEKVVDEVGGTTLLNVLRPRLRQIQLTETPEKENAADFKIQHEGFARDFLRNETEVEAAEFYAHLPKGALQKKHIDMFNAMLTTQGKHHPTPREWLKHLSNWLNRNTTNIQNDSNGTTNNQHSNRKIGRTTIGELTAVAQWSPVENPPTNS